MLAAEKNDRSAQIDNFLAASGYGDATRHPLGSDASFRRYERIMQGNQTTMLMDAPPPQEDVRPFIAITHELQSRKLSAPAILAQDVAQGFLLLEDLGDASFTRLLKATPDDEQRLYLAAAEVLVDIGDKRHKAPASVPPYDMSALMREVSLLSDWFLPQILGTVQAKALRAEYLALWESVLLAGGLATSHLVLRDYHADNLMWLEGREGLHRVGLLDYQDALMGDAAYDMVSFLEDARRDVSEQTREAVLDYYLQATGANRDDFMRRFCLLGAQRNSKIVGIFTRLCVRDGKAHYLDYLPRVWGLLSRDLQHPSLSTLKDWYDTHIPESARGVIAVDAKRGSLS